MVTVHKLNDNSGFFFSSIKLGGDAKLHRPQYTNTKFMFPLQSFHYQEVNSKWYSSLSCSSVEILLFMLVPKGLGLDLGFNSVGM